MASNLPLLLLVLCSLNVAQCGLIVYNVYARGLQPDPVGGADGFVRIFCGSYFCHLCSASLTTRVYRNHANPSWSEELANSRASPGARLELQVYDKDVLFDDLLGVCSTTIQKGNHSNSCSLATGGTLYYSYTVF
uniref:C2 domain-containing protein n=1 Tax=Amphilophus citrinellus TaxID=61819 RepID=A0A3Q0SHF0_AMPCI